MIITTCVYTHMVIRVWSGNDTIKVEKGTHESRISKKELKQSYDIHV